MKFVIYAIVFIVLSIIMICVILNPYFKDKKVRKGIVNFDTYMRSYAYVLKCRKQDVIQKLSIHSINDKPEYLFDDVNLIITFLHLNVKIKYQLYFIENEGHTYLNVYQINFLHDKSNIPYMMNAFWINKVNAVPIEYSFFEMLNKNVNH